MALAAIKGETGSPVSGIGRTVVVAAVAGGTVGGRTIVLSARVTGSAIDGAVTTVERPAAVCEVGIPVAGVMTLGAVMGEAGGPVAGIGCSLKIAAVAGPAIVGCSLILPVSVTGTAIDAAVPAGQGKAGVVGYCGPVVGVVAEGTVGGIPGRLVIGGSCAKVILHVTALAPGREVQPGESSLGLWRMALPAIRREVPAGEGHPRRTVKFYPLSVIEETVHSMTAGAIIPQFADMYVLVTSGAFIGGRGEERAGVAAFAVELCVRTLQSEI